MRRVLLRLPRGVIATAMLVRVFDEWWSWLPAGSIDDLRVDLGLTYADAGWLLATLYIGGFVGAPLGALADHLPRKPLAVIGTLGLVLGLVPFAAGAPFAVLLGGGLVLGASSDMMIRPLEASLEQVGGESLDKLLGRQHVITWTGDLIGPALLALGAATALGWRGAFAITAATLAVYAVVLACTEFPPPLRAAASSATAWREAVTLGRRRDVVLLAGAEFVLGPLDEPLLGFAVARLAAGDDRALAQSLAIGTFVGGLIGSGLVSVVGLTPTTRRAGPLLLLAGAMVVAPNWPLLVTLAGMLITSVGMAITWATVHHRQLIAERGRAATVSTVIGVLATPAAAVPVVVGLIADTSTITVGLWCYAALAATMVLLIPAIDRAIPPAGPGATQPVDSTRG